jgi:hypothetical protein
MGSTSAASWRVELWYRGQLRSTTRRDVVLVGDGGHVVVPGLNGSHVLACGDRIECVEGLLGVDARGCAPALDARTTLHVAAHPEIEVVLVRERLERVEVSRVPMLPWREAVYGLAFAACVCAFISVKVAVSPARVREQEDRELAQELLVDVPIAFVVPPPVIDVTPIEPSPEAPAPSERDGVDETVTDVPEISEVAQLVAEAPPKPKAKRRRHEPEIVDHGTLTLVGVAAENSIGDMVVMSELRAAESDDEYVYGGLIGHEPGYVVAAREEVPTRVPGGVPGGVVEDAARTGEDAEGIDAEPTCAIEDDPKAKVDIVFVVDATAPMAKVHGHLSQQVADLNRRLVDSHPRYGLVAFGDDVELAKLTPMDSTELAAALEGMKEAAETRPLDAEVRDDVLGALDRAREFPWGDTRDTLRLIVLVTDNDYGDRGDELGEHTVAHSHARVADQLADESIRVSSITRRRVPGLDRERNGHSSIPAATAGIALRESVVYPRGGLADALADLLRNPVCLENLADVLVGE